MSEFYTVSQYAKEYGKDPGNIRRMLIKGLMEGEKVGSQWLIPKNVSYPGDRRVKSGEYKNWRQRVKLSGKHPELMKKLSEMSKEFADIHGANALEVVLYGSYARGQETSESDIDMAIILDGQQTEVQFDSTMDVVVDYQLELGVTLSVIAINQNEYAEWKATLPFYKNVDREGIVLWKKM